MEAGLVRIPSEELLKEHRQQVCTGRSTLLASLCYAYGEHCDVCGSARYSQSVAALALTDM